jgi:hypothetical protein
MAVLHTCLHVEDKLNQMEAERMDIYHEIIET